MLRSRACLHRSKLDEFKQWAISRGWVEEAAKGDYEVLRLRMPGKKGAPAQVYDRHQGAHLTTFGESQKLVRRWIRER
jgi:hypothetical protein